MTKKCFAAIMTAKDNSALIKEMTDTVLNGGMTKAYATIKKIAELNDTYIKQFGDIDPYWQPPTQPAMAMAETQAQPAATTAAMN